MKKLILIAWLMVLIASVLGANLTATTVQAADYDLKVAATEKTIIAYQAIKEYRDSMGLSLVDPIRGKVMDPMETGLLGYWQTDITTTSGELEAKQLAINPHFAAVVIDMITQMGLKTHDQVGVMASGSFPSLAIATLCALEVAELDYYTMVSAGASSYGANIPTLTLFDMIDVLYQANILKKNSEVASFGGQDDTGAEFPSLFQDDFRIRVETAGSYLLKPDSFNESINMRMNLYEEHLPHMACFINVGGHGAAMGEGTSTFLDGNGLIFKTKRLYTDERGLIHRYLEQDIPVVHLIQVRDLCLDYQLSLEPQPLVLDQNQPIFYNYRISPIFVITPLVLSIGLIIMALIKKKNFFS